MISEAIAFGLGTVVAGVTGVLVTAGHYRSTEALEVRRAVAKIKRHLEVETEFGLGELKSNLEELCRQVDSAEECVARSKWAKRHRNLFLVGCADVMTAREEVINQENSLIFNEGRQLVKDSGEMLFGYLQFPSWLWCKATFYRTLSPLINSGKL